MSPLPASGIPVNSQGKSPTPRFIEKPDTGLFAGFITPETLGQLQWMDTRARCRTVRRIGGFRLGLPCLRWPVWWARRQLAPVIAAPKALCLHFAFSASRVVHCVSRADHLAGRTANGFGRP